MASDAPLHGRHVTHDGREFYYSGTWERRGFLVRWHAYVFLNGLAQGTVAGDVRVVAMGFETERVRHEIEAAIEARI